jgi:hypothetical protein
MRKLIRAFVSKFRPILPAVEHWLHNLSIFRELVIREFHKLYYEASSTGGTWLDTYWLGVPTLKCPLDLWVYQEILFETRPNLIVETGTALAGALCSSPLSAVSWAAGGWLPSTYRRNRRGHGMKGSPTSLLLRPRRASWAKSAR